MPPRNNRSTTLVIKENVRTVSPSNSISSSQQESEIEQEQNDSKHYSNANHSERMNWSSLVPVIGMTILTWAQQANARVRQHATACCSGDFCIGTDTIGPNIPEEISFQKCKNQSRKSLDVRSVASTPSLQNSSRKSKSGEDINPDTDIELTTFEASSVIGMDVNDTLGYDTSWTVPHPIRHTKWNEIPDDPVDEVSLKGSSMYMSSDDDDVMPYDDDDYDNHIIDIQKLQHHFDRVKKVR